MDKNAKVSISVSIIKTSKMSFFKKTYALGHFYLGPFTTFYKQKYDIDYTWKSEHYNSQLQNRMHPQTCATVHCLQNKD